MPETTAEPTPRQALEDRMASMSFLEHLEELRRRIIYSLVAVGVGLRLVDGPLGLEVGLFALVLAPGRIMLRTRYLHSTRFFQIRSISGEAFRITAVRQTAA